MTRYILIDNTSGYLWSDCEAADPISACRDTDRDLGTEAREYEDVTIYSLASNETGYHVYAATENFPEVVDGQDREMIDLVTETLKRVASVRVTLADDE